MCETMSSILIFTTYNLNLRKYYVSFTQQKLGEDTPDALPTDRHLANLSAAGWQYIGHALHHVKSAGKDPLFGSATPTNTLFKYNTFSHISLTCSMSVTKTILHVTLSLPYCYIITANHNCKGLQRDMSRITYVLRYVQLSQFSIL